MIIHTDSFRYLWEVLENHEYNMLFDDLVVFDAGCNVGAFSLWIYPHTKMIYAVDMDEKNLKFFEETIKANELKSIKLYQERLLDLAGFMSGHDIPVVDVLKLDIEGDEVELLENNFPKDKVRVIVGEYHARPVREILKHLGYRYKEYPNQHFVARI